MYNPDDVIDKYLLDRYDVLSEMAQIGYVGSYQIYIHTNDPGNVPHFHICDRETSGDKFHACVRLDKAEYFHHTGKTDVLNSQQRKALVEFMNTQCKYGLFSNWSFTLMLWNANNSDVEIDLDAPMPDYIRL